MVSLNMTAVSDLRSASPTAHNVLDDMSERERFRRYTNLDLYRQQLIRKGVKVVTQEYFDTFKKLEEIGAGKIVYGRKGNPHRFEWHFSLKDIAKGAKGQLEGSPKELYSKPKAKRGRPRKNIAPEVVKGPVVQSKGDTISISIPKDFLKALIKQYI